MTAIALPAYPPNRLTAQTVLEKFSSENLKPSAVQLDLGPIGGDQITGATTGGVRLDYGLVAPRVRVLLGLSYFQSEISAEARRRFEERLTSLINDPNGGATIQLGRVTWRDVAGDLDLQYVMPQGRGVTAYLGLGLGIHLRHGGGSAIDGTFVQDALSGFTAGLNGTLGAEVGGARWRFTADGRGVVSSGLSTLSLRAGVMYRWAGIGDRAKGKGG
jgi:hypothetical protein